MRLIADRFVCDRGGEVIDLATGDRVTFVRVRGRTPRALEAGLDRCREALEHWQSHQRTLIDVVRVGVSRWIEVYAAARSPARRASRVRPVSVRLIVPAALHGVAAAFDALGPRGVRRLRIRAPRGAGLTTMMGMVAREARSRGLVPICPGAIRAWPAAVPLLRHRSAILLVDRRSFDWMSDRERDVGRAARAGMRGAAGGVEGQQVDRWRHTADEAARALLALTRAGVSVLATVAWVGEDERGPALGLRPFPAALLASGVVLSSARPRGNRDLVGLARRAEGLPGPFMARLLQRAGRTERHDAGSAFGAAVAPESADAARRGLVAGRSYAEDLRGRRATSVTMPRPSPRGVRLSSAPSCRARPARVRRERQHLAGGIEAADRERPSIPGRRAPVTIEAAPRRDDVPEVGRDDEGGGWCEGRSDVSMVSGYGDAIDALLVRGRWEEAARELRVAFASAERRRDVSEAARAALASGRLCLARCDVEASERWFDEAGERAERAGQAGLAADVLRWSGVARLDAADLDRSERLLRTARAAAGSDSESEQGRAIELSLARCLFWQGRHRDIEWPRGGEDDDGVGVEYWRRRARWHLAGGDIGQASRAVTAAAHLPLAGASLAANDARMACRLEAARLQLAIGDAAGCDAHLAACVVVPRARARIVRLQLLHLQRLATHPIRDQKRRLERLGIALRQARMPALVRIRARYWIEPAARRSAELAAFIERHGESALAGWPDERREAPMLEAFQSILQICHETPDELAALARVATFVRERLNAACVLVHGAPVARGRLAMVGSTRLATSELAVRVIDSGLVVPPAVAADAIEAAAPIRYGGQTIGALVARWIIDTRVESAIVAALLGAAAAAIAPQVRAMLDRDPLAAVLTTTAVAGGRDGHPQLTRSASAGGSAARNFRADAAAKTARGASVSSAGTGGAIPATANSTSATFGLIGVSAVMDTLRQQIARSAVVPFHVLIEGESGSGKELVARALHLQGPRRHRRFCAINCAALTDELLEAELFGHARGAFTGAMTERAGLFEEADGGTLFLDEIGELSARGQAKLLRAIQDGETRRVGENLPRRVDARVVAATNRSLRREAAAGQFRADLLYRLDVVRINVPPLRERPEDIQVLARAFWDEAIARTGSRATLDPDTLAALARYHWPGNVRELHNAIMALTVHAPPRGRVGPSALAAAVAADATVFGELPAHLTVSFDAARRAFEERFVRTALARAGGQVEKAARDLGISRQGLRKLMTRLGMTAPVSAGKDDGR